MSVKCFLLVLACAAILARVETSLELTEPKKRGMVERPDKLLSSDANDDSSVVVQPLHKTATETKEEARSLFLPSSFEATVHG